MQRGCRVPVAGNGALQSSLHSSATVCKSRLGPRALTEAGKRPAASFGGNEGAGRQQQRSQVGQSRNHATKERHFALCNTRSRHARLPAARPPCSDTERQARDRRAVLGLRRDGLAARHARHHLADPAEPRARPDAEPRHPLRRRQRGSRHADLALRSRQPRVLSRCVGRAQPLGRRRRRLRHGRGRGRCAAAGRPASRHGVRGSHPAPRHAQRDDGATAAGRRSAISRRR